MFRLLAHNAGPSLRPVLLRNVRPSAPLKLSGHNASVELERNFQFRNNSSAAATPATPATPPAAPGAGRFKKNRKFADKSVEKPVATSAGAGASQFEQLLFKRAGQMVGARAKAAPAAQYGTIKQLTELFRDDAVKADLSADNLYDYANLLNEAIYTNRYSRLNDNRNRDTDMYSSVTLANDIWMKNAILDLADALSGPLQNLASPRVLRKLLFAMLQLRVTAEMIKFWEQGVNSPQHSHSYLAQSVLAVMLPVAHAEKRFSYDQIVKLFEVNTRDTSYVAFQLTAAVGKIAIEEGDYSRALDCLEQLLAHLETGRFKHTEVHRTLAELHMAFIGECRDIRIARHFFAKTLEDALPYRVVLKAPHVQKLMEHCEEAGEPFETIVDFWRQTVANYASEPSSTFNARYSMLNKTFFVLFFRYYPTLTEASYAKLKEVIAIYASIKSVDDYFLNNIISNYTWGDNAVFAQLCEHHAAYNVTPSAVSYRVILKKMGEIRDVSNADILRQWLTTLQFLDGAGFSYIPIADWASLREATILSPFREDRTELYLAVLHAYRNYHQDDKAVHRFVRYWSTKPEDYLVARVTEANPEFACDLEIEVPEFVNLRENVDYNVLARNLVVSTREENMAQSAALHNEGR